MQVGGFYGLDKIGGTWSYNSATGVWTNAPLKGPETILKGDFESGFTAGVGNDWSLYGTPTSTADETVIVYSGSHSQKVVANAANQGVTCDYGGTVGLWMWASARLYAESGGARLVLAGGNFNKATTITGAFEEVSGVFQANGNFGVYLRSTGANTFYGDAVSKKQLLPSSLFAARNFGQQVPFVVNATFDAGYCAGVVTRLDNPANPLNYVLCWHDRTNIRLDKVINGVVTNLLTSAVAYVAGAKIGVVPSGDNFQATYNEVNIGAPQAAADVPAGTWAGMFSPDSSVQLTNPSWS